MKRNQIAQQILAETPPETRQFVRRYAELTVLVHEIMESKGWTQKDLAEKLGKKPSEISKWLRGEHNFTLRSLTKLEVELGEDLFTINRKSEAKKAQSPTKIVFFSSQADLQAKPSASAFKRTQSTVSHQPQFASAA